MEKTFLHVGCGNAKKKDTTAVFAGPEWKELRFDIDPAVKPDFIGSMTDMHAVASASMDALYSSHNIEHLYPHEVPVALGEFSRVLKPEGFAVITCPDLQSVAALVAEDKLTETAYLSSSGPIAPMDILFGHRASLAAGNLFMAHRCGFTEKVLKATLLQNGFVSTATMKVGTPIFALWAVATKSPMDEAQIVHLARRHFPDYSSK